MHIQLPTHQASRFRALCEDFSVPVRRFYGRGEMRFYPLPSKQDDFQSLIELWKEEYEKNR